MTDSRMLSIVVGDNSEKPVMVRVSNEAEVSVNAWNHIYYPKMHRRANTNPN